MGRLFAIMTDRGVRPLDGNRYYSEGDVLDMIRQHNPSATVYRSTFQPVDCRSHYKRGQGSSVAYSSEMVIDIDAHDAALQPEAERVVATTTAFLRKHDISFHLYRTARGAHVEVADTGLASPHLPQMFKSWVSHFIGKSDVIDTHSFNAYGLVSIPGSYLHKAGFFKLPATMQISPQVGWEASVPLIVPPLAPSPVLRDMLIEAHQTKTKLVKEQAACIDPMHHQIAADGTLPRKLRTYLETGTCPPASRHRVCFLIAVCCKHTGQSEEETEALLASYTHRLVFNGCCATSLDEALQDVFAIVNDVYSTDTFWINHQPITEEAFHRQLEAIIRYPQWLRQLQKGKVLAAMLVMSEKTHGGAFWLSYQTLRNLKAYPTSCGRNFIVELERDDFIQRCVAGDYPMDYDESIGTNCYRVLFQPQPFSGKENT